MATVQAAGGGTNLRGAIALLGLFCGACAIFVLVAAASDAWHERAQKGWPVAAATIERCGLDSYYPFQRDGGGVVWNIDCRVAYSANGDQGESRIRSRSARGNAEIEEMRRWVAGHPSGSSITIHYDPADARRVVLVETDMPFSGPRTPNNLKLLLIASVLCVVFLAVARFIPNRG